MLGYLALLALLAAAVTTANVSMHISRGITQFKATRWWDNNLPEIAIAGGKASSPVAQPYRKDFGDTVFILDTTGQTTGVEPGAPNTVLVTETQFLLRQSRRGQTRVHDLNKFPDMVLNQANIEAWLDGVTRWLWAAIAVALFCWLWVMKLFQVLFWSILGLIVNAVSGRRLRYGALFNIGLLALTVPWIFDLVVLFAGTRARITNWVSFSLYIGYLVWGILAQPKATTSTSPTADPVSA
jgi:hypothetical protein